SRDVRCDNLLLSFHASRDTNHRAEWVIRVCMLYTAQESDQVAYRVRRRLLLTLLQLVELPYNCQMQQAHCMLLIFLPNHRWLPQNEPRLFRICSYFSLVFCSRFYYAAATLPFLCGCFPPIPEALLTHRVYFEYLLQSTVTFFLWISTIFMLSGTDNGPPLLLHQTKARQYPRAP